MRCVRYASCGPSAAGCGCSSRNLSSKLQAPTEQQLHANQHLQHSNKHHNLCSSSFPVHSKTPKPDWDPTLWVPQSPPPSLQDAQVPTVGRTTRWIPYSHGPTTLSQVIGSGKCVLVLSLLQHTTTSRQILLCFFQNSSQSTITLTWRLLAEQCLINFTPLPSQKDPHSNPVRYRHKRPGKKPRAAKLHR